LTRPFRRQKALPTAISTGSWLGETAWLGTQGQEIPVSQLVLSHKSPQGELEFFSTIIRDIRASKEYEQKLEQSNAELLRATRLKDEFLANMSHELRTPLNAILGMAEGLLEEVYGVLNDRQQRAIATIERSGIHLLELIEDILDVSKIAAGKLELLFTTVEVTQICNSSWLFVKQLAVQNSIQLTTNFAADLGAIVVDERRLRQVLINLLNNAIKFTPSGGQVTLDVYWQESSLCFAITDTGIGIAATDFDRLFQPFIQIDSSLNRQYDGTGLGLTLVKQIVEQHGGYVTFTSNLGQGSCFMVYLPDTCRSTDPTNKLYSSHQGS
jgi:signal transduction histidine kinase